MKKVLITGPESTGKSTLCEELAKHYSSPSTVEFAREYLNKLNRDYNESDLLPILKGQLALEFTALKEPANKNASFLFCDTGPEVIYVWSQYNYGRVHPEIINCFKKHTYDLVLLLNTDLPWQFDSLRENPKQEERNTILNQYIELFKTYNIPFEIISGSHKLRFENAKLKIKQHYK